MSSPSTSSSSDSERPTTTALKSHKKRQPPVSHTPVSDSDSDGSSDDETSSDSDSESSDSDDAPEDEVPVLSHKEKRRQKKKEQKVETAPEEQSEDPSKLKKQKVKNTAELAPSKIPKRQNSIWVGNLAFKTTPESLRKFFDGAGEITRVHMPMKLASAGPGGRGTVKENRGFAYVDFATPEAKVVAITLSENNLDGRRLLIKDGDDYTGRPSTSAQAEGDADDGKPHLVGLSKTAQKILRSQKQPAGPTIFFGNLGFETTDQSLRDMLDNHRSKKPSVAADAESTEDKAESTEKQDKWIRKVRMGTFEDSGKCKGWAFVDFTSIENATAALTNPRNFFLDGRKLVVEYASPEAVRRGGGPRGDRDKTKDTRDNEKPNARRGERVRPTRKRTAEDGDPEGDEVEKPVKRVRLEENEVASEHPVRERREGEGRQSKFRAKPGAALAMAKRETVSIVPSQGKKIVF